LGRNSRRRLNIKKRKQDEEMRKPIKIEEMRGAIKKK
jgi:hypothetical protein